MFLKLFVLVQAFFCDAVDKSLTKFLQSNLLALEPRLEVRSSSKIYPPGQSSLSRFDFVCRKRVNGSIQI